MNVTPSTPAHDAAGLPAGFGPGGVAFRLPRGRWPAHAPVALLAVLVALVALLPLGFIVWITVQTGWQTAGALVFRGRVGELLTNTVLLEVLAVPAATLLAISLAWLTERSDLPGARLWSWVAVAPLAVPAFVQSYAWVTIVPGMSGLWAGVLVSVLAYFPFLYLPISAQLRRLDPALEDVAASLGEGPWRAFFRVVVPQLRLSICGGALLVSLHLLAEYGLFAMIRFDTFTTAIYDQFQSAFNGPAANMLAGVLVLLCFALLGSEGLLRGSERYARIGSGAPAPRSRKRLATWRLPALVLFAATAALSLGVPAFTLARWLVAGGARIWAVDELAGALGTTGLYAIAGAALTTLAAIPVAWLSVRAPGRLQRLVEACHYYAGSLPGVVVALALVAISVRVALPLYQTVATLLLAYAMMFVPRALVGLRASLAQTPPELERAAAALGRPPAMTLWAVTMRLAAPGAAASFALVALGIMTELTATLMLAPNGATTLAMRFWSLTSELDYAAAAPYALLMVAFSLPLTLLLMWQSERVSRP
jgi:iron(III) transport system permease protein